MLPIARPGLAPALRQTVSSRIAAPRSIHISARPISRTSTARLTSFHNANASALRPGAAALTAGSASVFASRSGAARNLSLWPFSSSKPQAPSVEAAAAPSPNVPESTPASASDAYAASASPYDSATPAQAAAPESLPSPGGFDDLGFLSVADIPEQIGYLKNLGLDFGWGPTSMVESALEHIHVYSGMPWWGSIVTMAILWRAAIFVPSIIAARHSALLAKAQNDPRFKELREEFNEAAYRSKDQQAMMTAQAKMKAITRSSGAKLRWIGVPLLTVPFSIGMFRLLRAMATIPVPGLETGGFLWITDLSIADPLYILPILNVVLGSLMFHLARKSNTAAPNPTMEKMMGFMKYGLPPIIFLSTFWLPACATLFFTAVSAGTVLQSAATANPSFRHMAGLPPLPVSMADAVRQGGDKLAAGKWEAPKKAGDLRQSLQDSLSAVGGGGLGSSLTGKDAKAKAWEKAGEYETKRATEEKQREARRLEDLRLRRTAGRR